MEDTGAAEAAAEAAEAAEAEATSWRDGLPEDMRSMPTFEKFKDETEMISMPINVARSYMNAEQMIGRDKIPMPKSPEEWDNTYKRLGKPDTAELYELPVSDKLDPELAKMVEEDSKWFREKAFELGLNSKQASELFSSFSELSASKLKEMRTFSDSEKLNNEVQLRTEFGSAYDGKMVLANRAVQKLGGEEFMQLIDSTGVGSHPAFIRFNMKVGAMMAEDLGLDKNTGELLVSNESVKDQIATIQSTPEYTDATNPAHIAAVNKVAKLMQHLHGNTSVLPQSR